MHKIEITIKGLTGSGKTTVGFLIQQALIDAGFDNTFLFDDIPLNELLTKQKKRIKSLKENLEININMVTITTGVNKGCIGNDNLKK